MALPDWAIIGGIITSAVGSLILTLKARPEARKMDREGGAAILTAGAGLVKETLDELTDLRREMRDMRAWRDGLEHRLRRHSKWDDAMVRDAREQGRDVPDPPPLYDDKEQVI